MTLLEMICPGAKLRLDSDRSSRAGGERGEIPGRRRLDRHHAEDDGRGVRRDAVGARDRDLPGGPTDERGGGGAGVEQTTRGAQPGEEVPLRRLRDVGGAEGELPPSPGAVLARHAGRCGASFEDPLHVRGPEVRVGVEHEGRGAADVWRGGRGAEEPAEASAGRPVDRAGGAVRSDEVGLDPTVRRRASAAEGLDHAVGRARGTDREDTRPRPGVGHRAGRGQVLHVVGADEEDVDRHADGAVRVHREVEVPCHRGVVLKGERLDRWHQVLVELVVEGPVDEARVRDGRRREGQQVEVDAGVGEGVPASVDLDDAAGGDAEADERVERRGGVRVDGIDEVARLVDDVPGLGRRSLRDAHVGVAHVAGGHDPQGAVPPALVDGHVDAAAAVSPALGEGTDRRDGHLHVVRGQVVERGGVGVQVVGVVDTDEVEGRAGRHVVDDLRDCGAVLGLVAGRAAAERGGDGRRELRAELR